MVELQLPSHQPTLHSQSLIKNNVDYETLVDVFDERGIRIRAVKRNGKEHHKLWKENSRLRWTT
jgi:hypothetical protein